MSSTLTRSQADMGTDATTGPVGQFRPPAEPLLAAGGPFRRRESMVAAIIAAVGLAGLAWCWAGAADEPYWREQLDWVTGAAIFTVVFVLAVAGWIITGTRRLRRGFRVLAARMNTVLGLDEVGTAHTPGVVSDDSVLVRAHPMNRVHRPSCLLLRGKHPVVVPTHEVDSYSRCGVCRS